MDFRSWRPGDPDGKEWRDISTAPRDGTFVRARDRFATEDVVQWQDHDCMKTGGSWFTRDGHIFGTVIAWQPEFGRIN